MKNSGHHHSGEGGKECSEAFEKMSEYLDEELDSGTFKRLENHFSNCPLCLMVLKTIKKTAEIFRKRPLDKIPKDASDKVRETIRAEIAKNR